MGFFISLLVGGAAGWAAAMLMRSAGLRRHLAIGAGMVGGLLGGFFFGPIFGGGNLFESVFYPMVIVDALLGAVILLGILYLLRHGRTRRTGPEGRPR